MGKPDAGASRVSPDAGRRGDDRTARAGTANAVGMAIAERSLAARFNRPGSRDRRTTARSLSSRTATSWKASPPRRGRSPATSVSESSSTSTTTTTSRSTARRRGPSPRTCCSATRPTGGRCCTSSRRRHGSRRRSTRRSARAIAETARPTMIARAHDDRLRLAAQGGHQQGARQPARRRGGRADEEGARLGMDRALHDSGGLRDELSDGASNAGSTRRRTGSAASPSTRSAFPDLAAAVAPRAKGRSARGLGLRSCRPGRRRVARDARRVGEGDQRDRAEDAVAPRRRRRPLRVDEDDDREGSASSTARPAPDATSTTASASTRWPRSPTAWRTTAAFARSSRRSSASPTTCGRRAARGASASCP